MTLETSALCSELFIFDWLFPKFGPFFFFSFQGYHKMACPNPMTKVIQFVWKPNKCIWTSCEKTTSLFHLTQDPSTENWGLNTASKIQLELVFPKLTRMQKRQTLILFILASSFLTTNLASIVGYQFKDNKSWKRYVQGSSLYCS